MSWIQMSMTHCKLWDSDSKQMMKQKIMNSWPFWRNSSKKSQLILHLKDFLKFLKFTQRRSMIDSMILIQANMMRLREITGWLKQMVLHLERFWLLNMLIILEHSQTQSLKYSMSLELRLQDSLWLKKLEMC